MKRKRQQICNVAFHLGPKGYEKIKPWEIPGEHTCSPIPQRDWQAHGPCVCVIFSNKLSMNISSNPCVLIWQPWPLFIENKINLNRCSILQSKSMQNYEALMFQPNARLILLVIQIKQRKLFFWFNENWWVTMGSHLGSSLANKIVLFWS